MDAWEDYRRRRNQFLLVFPTGMFALSGIMWVLSHIAPHEVFGWVFGLLSILLMAAFIVTAIRLQTFRCPRCGKWFFATWLYRNPFVRRCVHCRLPKWEVPQSEVTSHV